MMIYLTLLVVVVTKQEAFGSIVIIEIISFNDRCFVRIEFLNLIFISKNYTTTYDRD